MPSNALQSFKVHLKSFRDPLLLLLALQSAFQPAFKTSFRSGRFVATNCSLAPACLESPKPLPAPRPLSCPPARDLAPCHAPAWPTHLPRNSHVTSHLPGGHLLSQGWFHDFIQVNAQMLSPQRAFSLATLLKISPHLPFTRLHFSSQLLHCLKFYSFLICFPIVVCLTL